MNINFILPTLLLLVGLYGLVAKKDLVQIFFGLIVMEIGVEMFLVALGEKEGATISLGLAVAGLLALLIVKASEKFGNTDISKLRELKG